VENLVTPPLPDPTFWAGRRVLLTGHTGFKGAWTALWLESMGAQVTGLSLAPETNPSLFELLAPWTALQSIIGDIRDRSTVAAAVSAARPSIALHMAAQPLVRRSYREPVETFATNVMGTAHVLEALREVPELQAALFVTTDKVYRNLDDGRPFAEDDVLGGHDPYSASKAACELTVQCWAGSYFRPKGVAMATVRGGNVVGGGDWSEDRLVPDLVRAAQSGQPAELRFPDATRPWQHVLDCAAGYLVFVERLVAGGAPAALNIGPDPEDRVPVRAAADIINAALSGAPWIRQPGDHPPEMALLSLDPRAARAALGYRPRLRGADALAWAADWYRDVAAGTPAGVACLTQIERYCALPGVPLPVCEAV
jgi:CDP-glucose 4,6-dehydratase